MPRILMVASENDALRGAKVGGIGDVVRDVPRALARLGCHVTTIIPSHGFLHQAEGSQKLGAVLTRFGPDANQGAENTPTPAGHYELELWRVPDRVAGGTIKGSLEHYVLHHPVFLRRDPESGKPRLYWHDAADEPFARDASTFACFCAGVGELLIVPWDGHFDILHLHDWHAGFLQMLTHLDARYASLRKLRSVFSIHNLQLQGIRPIWSEKNTPSCFEAWYPWLAKSREQLADEESPLGMKWAPLRDPRWSHCVNPMRAGIMLSDAVHLVSPTYAKEVQQPSDPEAGFVGGEGLERDLQKTFSEERLFGILNGCEYDEAAVLNPSARDDANWRALLTEVTDYAAAAGSSGGVGLRAAEWLEKSVTSGRPKLILTSVSRLTAQKVALLLMPTADKEGELVIDHLLSNLAEDGVYLFLGSGPKEFETALERVMEKHSNFLFIKGYSAKLADRLFEQGDLFIMPSSFEPCGISQMLALRAGQPVLVHGVGGLRDTIRNRETGFVFEGKNPEEQAENLLKTFNEAKSLFAQSRGHLDAMRMSAQAERFSWEASARLYIDKLYG